MSNDANIYIHSELSRLEWHTPNWTIAVVNYAELLITLIGNEVIGSCGLSRWPVDLGRTQEEKKTKYP